ncbi:MULTISPECIES: ABC transporter permease [unclassified Campylobacter]|uniref:ABC transporter permease n=1 Tax=unclassified Campylobacter TaxID=2593542 RepID=UPI001238059B|nr:MULTISPECIES: ABC transporter permease [unclassified Campylobacter]KAA6227294.1 ABC transporter permease [Campylobacter sp. LR286c]KAA6227832.1 ABC transporter permease [Campylobacter sp. LR185c]KAA6228240.1 ABC transporter permease [Campylobacter sp. LR196d]KAA6229240.1 ABC transporter permease [Campylobacter sp. LR291e]KAA6231045.1 ABC transporter permease [Campylobacter sp. LR264d]
MLVNMVKNSIFKNKLQKFLAFLTCFLATLLICTMLNITLSIGNEITKQLRSYGSNIVVLPKGSSLSIEIGNQIYEPLKNKSYLEEKDLKIIKEIFWQNNITAFAPFLEGELNINDKKALVVGTYFNKDIPLEDEDFQTGIKTLYPFIEIQGKLAKDDSLEEIMLGDEFATNNNLKIGDKLLLNNKEVEVVGIILHANKLSNKIITSLKLAQNLFDKEGLYARAEVSALTIPEDDLAKKARRDVASLDAIEHDTWYCSAYVGSIAYQIEEELPGVSAKPLNSISDAESLVVKKIQSLMGVTSLICIIVASIAIASLMSSEINSRKKEIGLLKVLGANTFQIYLIFASENLIVALVAAICGFICGIGISELISFNIFGYLIQISFIALPLSLIFAGFIAILGCLLPIKSIMGLSAWEVLCGR